MDEIYRKAARVNVWLGPSTPATDAEISSLKKTSLLAIAAMIPGPFLDWRKGLPERRVADLRGPHADNLPCGLVGSLLTRSWFRRMWVVQEVAMSGPNVVWFYCGEQMIRFELLYTAVVNHTANMPPSERHWSMSLRVPRLLKEAIQLRDKGEPIPQPAPFSWFLSTLIWKFATKPEDKIFAFYGIAKHLGWPLPPPDYGKPVHQIYTEATRCAIQQDQSLLLLHIVTGTSRIENLPSWVPDFAQIPSCLMKEYLAFGASKNTLVQCHFTENGRCLNLNGQFIDVIKEWGSPLVWSWEDTGFNGRVPTADMYQVAYQTIQEWIHITEKVSPHQYAEPLVNAFGRTLLMDTIDERDTAQILRLYPNFHSIVTQAFQTKFADGCPHNILHPNARETYLQSAEFRLMQEHVITTNIGRTLVLTERGLMGTAPDSAEADDVIVLFAGSRVPCVLRQQGE
ncbi:MAG: hypothetical protein Q9187_009392, partial [Circinaria calcarea]